MTERKKKEPCTHKLIQLDQRDRLLSEINHRSLAAPVATPHDVKQKAEWTDSLRRAPRRRCPRMASCMRDPVGGVLNARGKERRKVCLCASEDYE